MNFQVALLTNKGGRKENEDFCAFQEKDGYGCFLVADGLGGHRGGAMASHVTCDSILNAFVASPGASETHLLEYINHARHNLQTKIGETNDILAPRTTLVVMLTDNLTAIWAHIGDSRLYHFRDYKLVFQTRDHSVPQQLANCGEIKQEEVRFHEDRNRLINVFDGNENNRIEFSLNPTVIKKGDAFLLCSDGFWEYILEAEMEKYLARSKTAKKWMALMKKRLLKRAVKNHDNYSALAIRITG